MLLLPFFPVVSQISCINQTDISAVFWDAASLHPFSQQWRFRGGALAGWWGSWAAKPVLGSSAFRLSCPWLPSPELALSLRNSGASGSLALSDPQIHHLKTECTLSTLYFLEPLPHPGNARPRFGGPPKDPRDTKIVKTFVSSRHSRSPVAVWSRWLWCGTVEDRAAPWSGSSITQC